MKKNDKKAYSIIIVIILIWFMIFLTTWVFRLVLNERNDNEAIWNYSKAYLWAESAQELALLEIKEKWYWYDKKLTDSDILWNNKKTAKISYKNDWKTKTYSWVLEPLSYNIIPLFYIKENSVEIKTDNYNLNLISWDNKNFSWNIIWKEKWISWNWENTKKWVMKNLKEISDNYNFSYNWDFKVSDFLYDSDTNYLILFNNSSSEIKYEINSNSYFTKPKLSIISSAWIGYFKQNIKTDLNYVDIVNKAKYSIYSE